MIPVSKCPKANASARSGFTILEILVAVAVLMLLVLLIGQLMSNTNSTINSSRKRIDSLGQARAVFDRLTFDFGGRLKRDDVDASFVKDEGNDACAFYSVSPGLYPSTTKAEDTRKLSVVGYRVKKDSSKRPHLERGALGLAWPEMVFTPVSNGRQEQKFTLPNSLPEIDGNGGPSNFQVLSESVFRFELSYLLKPTSTTPAPRLVAELPADPTQVSAVVVTIAVLDERSRKLVEDFDPLTALLPDAEDGKDPLSVWTGVVQSGDFASRAGIPEAAAQSVRIYQRYFPLQ